MKAAHPYEEVAYDLLIFPILIRNWVRELLENLTEPMEEKSFLNQLKTVFSVPVIRHTSFDRQTC